MKKIFLAFALLSLVACTSNEEDKLNGHFTGIDGSNTSPHDLKISVSQTGDGLIAGLWSSDGIIKKGDFFGQFASVSNEIKLKVVQGDCTGEFLGTFTGKKGVFEGTLKGNPNCPEQVFHFRTKRASN